MTKQNLMHGYHTRFMLIVGVEVSMEAERKETLKINNKNNENNENAKLVGNANNKFK